MPTEIKTLPYLQQSRLWPTDGQHILAYYDAESILVYQAYRTSIGEYAIRHGQLGGPEFSFARMSWIKPNFLWMMYRSGWGTKPGQEVTLGLRIRRSFFEELLRLAVPSAFGGGEASAQAAWQQAVAASEVRRQWDPDHGPRGEKLARRAIQLGLRGQMLQRLATIELLEVIDMRPLVDRQRGHLEVEELELLETPAEAVYLPFGA